jgi:methionine--tRNA ligase beta chain
MIDFEEFLKVELKVAKVIGASRVEGSEKILKLDVSLGEENRQILAGIGRSYAPDDLIGKEVVVVANLEPRMIMGMESQGMIVAATDENGLAVVMCPEREVAPGSGLK